MGAWGVGAFDNDTAADWAWEFAEADQAAGLRLLTEALEAVTETADGEIDSHAGERAVAAAQLVAVINGVSADRSAYSEEAVRWIERTEPSQVPELTNLARQALLAVRSPESELAELWDESGPEWRTSLEELAARLE
jgi:hypothetical protein